MNDAIAAEHAALVAAVAQTRDRAAFAMLFDFYAPRVKGFLMRGGCSPEEADEVTQEAMLSVWTKAASFDAGRAGVSTWIYTIARNARIDSARRRVMESLDLDDEDAGPPDAPAERPDALLAARQREQRVQAAVQHLPDEQARVVLLSFFAGRPHAELATELGIPLGTVKSRLRIAFDKLRTVLKDVAE